MTLGAPAIDSGATAWLLASTALVLLMTPGVAFFYGGMVRAKNVLAMLMQNFAAIAIVSVVWMLVAFSVAFSRGNDFFGNLHFAGLAHMDEVLPGFGSASVPTVAFVAFQMMFAVITPALVTGATADRWRFSAFAIFVAVWSVLVYAPIAHWVFSPTGWANRLGALDFAGGTVVHINAGAAALAMAILLGRRRDWPHRPSRPHNLPLVMIGAALLWFGWFGFNAGSALRADGVAASALINTQLAACTGLLSWVATERFRVGRATTLGAASGVVAGLVAITPCAGYVDPLGAAAIGAIAGPLCALLVGLKTWLNLDDSCDVVAVHLGGGIIGSLCVGLFATRAINPAGANGLLYGGGYRQLGNQAIAVVAVALYSFVATFLIGGFLGRVLRHRVRPHEELTGIDLSQHGESAYEFRWPDDDPPAAIAPEAAVPAQAGGTTQPRINPGAVPSAGRSEFDSGRHASPGSAPFADPRGRRSS